MDFIKKHYEKVLLGVVLVGLAGVAAFLPFYIASQKALDNEMTSRVLNPKIKQLTNLDLSLPQAALKRATAPATIDLAAPNRLFNPMPWQQTPPPEKRLIPAQKVGPSAMLVTNIVPLYLRLTLDDVSPTDSGIKYIIGIEKQAATKPEQRGKKSTYCKLNDKNDTFQLIEIKGKADDAAQVKLVVQLTDTGETATITKDVPYKRVDGYMADLRYDLEKRTWSARRVNSQPLLPVNGEDYNIVAITQNEVVLSAKSNGKKWTIKANPN